MVTIASSICGNRWAMRSCRRPPLETMMPAAVAEPSRLGAGEVAVQERRSWPRQQVAGDPPTASQAALRASEAEGRLFVPVSLASQISRSARPR